jgi:hypothetical protein
MVRTWWHKLFSQGQSGIHRGDRRARVRQGRRQKPWLESLEDRTLPSLFAPVIYDARGGGLAVGDLRGNGRFDIVTGGSVLLGNGDGSFQPAVNFATASSFVTLANLRPGGPLDVITTGSGTVNVLLGNGDGTFRPAVQYTADPQASPIAVAAGDFTGRGIPDLVTANVNDDPDFPTFSFSVLAGNGDGTFQTAVTHTLSFQPSSLAAGDFTGTGHFSIAMGTTRGVMVLLGNGDGTFQDPVFNPADPNSFVSYVLARDLAGTGKLDLVTANPQDNSVSVLRGNGDGTFGPVTIYPVGGRFPRTVAAGRFRPGGPLDLVTTNSGSGSVSVLPGAGDGTFGQSAQYAPGTSGPGAVAAADFAGRGTDDLVATNSGAVSVLLNRGDGIFPPLDTIHFGQGRFSLATGDFRGIGVQDLVTANEFAETVEVRLGNGDGTFGPPRSFPAGPDPIQVVVGDFNGDGQLDLAVAGVGGSTAVRLLLGNGDGTFQAPRAINTGGVMLSIAAGHFHDSNILDLVTTDFQDNRANVMLGNGDGTFQAPVSYAVHGGSVAVGDLRGNGITDLIVANGSDNAVSVLLGNGDGTFGPAVNYPVGNSPQFVAVGNLRSNGPLDIVATTFGRPNVTVLLGNGDGTFGAPTQFDAGVGTGVPAIAAFNGDGIPDVLVINNSTGTVSLLPGNGDGTFRPRVRFAVGTRPRTLAVGDFNGDNLPDVAVLNDVNPPFMSNDATISVLTNDGRPSRPGPGGAPSRGHLISPGRRGFDPGVFRLPVPARGATAIPSQPAANTLPQGAPPEAGVPLPAGRTVENAADAVFASSHRSHLPAPWAAEEINGLDWALALAPPV